MDQMDQMATSQAFRLLPEATVTAMDLMEAQPAA
jgi:hypothetical protein